MVIFYILTLFLLNKEVLTSISNKHGVKYETVEQTYTRIKRYLTERDLLFRSERKKSHRIMKDGKWITDENAIKVSDKIRSLWRNLFLSFKENSVTDARKKRAE